MLVPDRGMVVGGLPDVVTIMEKKVCVCVSEGHVTVISSLCVIYACVTEEVSSCHRCRP